jgi:protein TonB
MAIVVDLVPAAAARAATSPWLGLLPWILAAGVLARVAWVVAGLARLRALRRRGVPAQDELFDELQRVIGTSAECRVVNGLAQPVTFGVRPPVVLLPQALVDSPEPLRRAVVAHELIHVRRRDWVWLLAEEALRAAFWFHPAVWWLTTRVQLAREEFTDHVAVLATGNRRAYVEALVQFADTAAIEPAPAFARRAHLFRRIVLLSQKEASMSSRRIVLSGALITALFVTGAWYTSEAFPLPPLGAAPLAQAPLPPGTNVYPITPENPIPRRVVGTPIPYPNQLRGSGFEAAVDMHVTLNASGSVASVRPGAGAVSDAREPGAPGGMEAIGIFQAAAADAISQWHYDPPVQGPIAFYVGVTFGVDAEGVVSQSVTGHGVSANPSGARLGTDPRLYAETRIRMEQTIRELEGRSGSGGGQDAAARQASPVVPPAPGAPVRIGGTIRAPRQTRRVAPVYPPIAQSARVSGVVIVEATVDEQGRVTDVRVLRSIPLLDQAAIDAVRQWEYEPVLLNGVPVPVVMTVTVSFPPE